MTGPEAPITPQELESWRTYIGHREVRRQLLDVESLRRFAVAVGSTPEVEQCQPPLGHWAWFLETPAAARLGTDGHPQRGRGLFPPIRLARRLFAAGSLRFFEPLRLGQEAELTLSVADVRQRSGKAGDLVFLEVDRVLRQQGRERVAEHQTIVYVGLGGRTDPIAPVDFPVARDEALWTPSPIELFRFSAVTFNAHRIHYDTTYARGEEGYPDLVVHGPLTAVKLLAFAQARTTQSIRAFSFRANGPLFVNQPVRLQTGDAAGGVNATRCDGLVAMAAQADTR
jgi:3-methylfumaryl-CoA hydratase